MKKIILQYAISTLIAAIFTFLLLWYKGIFVVDNTKDALRYWIDSLFTSGVLFAAAGLLVVASNGGAFDFLVYGIYRFLTIFKSRPNEIKYKTYYDYQTAKSEREKRSIWFLIVVGAVFIVASLIVLYFWYQIPGSTN